MRALPARRIASTAFCAALLVGITGPAALAADSGGGRTQVTTRAAAPGTDALRARVHALGEYGGALTPVTDLLKTVLDSRHGHLPAREKDRLVAAAEHAVAEVRPAATDRRHRAADPQDDALAALQKSLDALVKAITSGDLGQLIPAVTGAVDGIVDVVTGLLTGSLTAPDLPSVPSLPSVPGVSSVPSVPGVSLPDLSTLLPAGTSTATEPADDATVTVPDEDATVTVPDEDATVTVPADDDEVVTLPAELTAD